MHNFQTFVVALGRCSSLISDTCTQYVEDLTDTCVLDNTQHPA